MNIDTLINEDVNVLSSKISNGNKLKFTEIERNIAGMTMPGSAIKDVIESFKNEDSFITNNRPICLWIILSIVMISVVAILSLIGLNIYYKIDTIVLITSLTTLLVEILGLLSIVFKYLFNRSENKVLDIVSDIIKNIISKK